MTERFAEVVNAEEAGLRLDEAALLLAAHAQPGLDVAAELRRLDELAARCPSGTVDGVCQLLFGELGLRGDRGSYDDPRNSFLNQVLDRRLGIPISLSVLTIEIGRRVGVAFEPVGMPGHFLIRQRDRPEVLLDPFHAGRRLGLAECRELFHALFGPAAQFSPRLLQTTTPRAVLARMLCNLTANYRKRGDAPSLLWVATLRNCLPGRPPSERHELSRLFEDLGRFGEAAGLLDGLLAGFSGDSDTRAKLVTRANLLRARLN